MGTRVIGKARLMARAPLMGIALACAAAICLSLSPVDAMAAEGGGHAYTADEMRGKFEELKDEVHDNWDAWHELYLDSFAFTMGWNPLSDAGGGTWFRNEDLSPLTIIGRDEFDALDEMDQFLLDATFGYSHRIVRDSRHDEYHNPENMMKTVESLVFLGRFDSWNEELSALLRDYHSYACDFWEATGLVYAPYEDVFYSGFRVAHDGEIVPGAVAEAPALAEGESAEDWDPFEGMSGEERRELEGIIAEVRAETQADERAERAAASAPAAVSASGDGGGGGLPGIAIAGIVAAAVVLIIVIAVAAGKRKDGFQGDPK